MPLPRLRSGLRHHRVDEQVLVYDAREDRTHLLDASTGTVLELLAVGDRSGEGLTSEVARRLGVAPDEAIVTLAFDELRKADLFDEERAPAPLGEVSRRELLRRAALAGATALLVPAIVTLTARTGYAATCVATCGTCTPGVSVCCTSGDVCRNSGGNPNRCRPGATGNGCNGI